MGNMNMEQTQAEARRVCRLFRPHEFKLLRSVAYDLQMAPPGRERMEQMQQLVTGRLAGFVCAVCGMTLREISQAGALCTTGCSTKVVCAPRPVTVRALQAGNIGQTLYDVLAHQMNSLAEIDVRKDISTQLDGLIVAAGRISTL